jgi:hypothetical protein
LEIEAERLQQLTQLQQQPLAPLSPVRRVCRISRTFDSVMFVFMRKLHHNTRDICIF